MFDTALDLFYKYLRLQDSGTLPQGSLGDDFTSLFTISFILRDRKNPLTSDLQIFHWNFHLPITLSWNELHLKYV